MKMRATRENTTEYDPNGGELPTITSQKIVNQI